MNKKVLSVALAGVMAMGIPTVSAFAEEKPYEGVTLTFWAGNAEYNDGTQAVMDAATEKLGMEFQVEINRDQPGRI